MQSCSIAQYLHFFYRIYGVVTYYLYCKPAKLDKDLTVCKKSKSQLIEELLGKLINKVMGQNKTIY